MALHALEVSLPLILAVFLMRCLDDLLIGIHWRLLELAVIGLEFLIVIKLRCSYISRLIQLLEEVQLRAVFHIIKSQVELVLSSPDPVLQSALPEVAAPHSDPLLHLQLVEILLVRVDLIEEFPVGL